MLDQLLDFVSKIFALVTSTGVSALVSSIGLILILVAVALVIFAVRSPGNLQPWHKWLLFVSLLGGMAFSATGPSLALFNIAENVIPRVTKERALKNLEENARIGWLIRLVAFNPQKQPHLTIDRLDKLGPDQHMFSFVAPYDELRGLSASEAILRLGGRYFDRQHVSAVIFPVPEEETIFPANARGVLQTIASVEASIGDGKFLIRDSDVISRDDRDDLSDTRIWTWKFENYRNRYIKYCKLTHSFRCNSSYSARKLIGDLNHDWHPLGLSQSVASDPCRMSVEQACSSDNWDTLKNAVRGSFGSRIFLIRNLHIREIPGRIMIDFNNPGYQLVPDIGLQTSRP